MMDETEELSATSLEQDMPVSAFPSEADDKDYILLALKASLIVADCIVVDTETSSLCLKADESPMYTLRENYGAPQ